MIGHRNALFCSLDEDGVRGAGRVAPQKLTISAIVVELDRRNGRRSFHCFEQVIMVL